MTRSTAFRAAALFIFAALVAMGLGIGSQAAAAEAMFLISASLVVITLAFGMATPARPALRPLHVRRNRSTF